MKIFNYGGHRWSAERLGGWASGGTTGPSHMQHSSEPEYETIVLYSLDGLRDRRKTGPAGQYDKLNAENFPEFLKESEEYDCPSE